MSLPANQPDTSYVKFGMAKKAAYGPCPAHTQTGASLGKSEPNKSPLLKVLSLKHKTPMKACGTLLTKVVEGKGSREVEVAVAGCWL